MMREERAMMCVCGKGLSLLIGGGPAPTHVCMPVPVKLDRNAFRSTLEVGFRPVEKAEHQGCIPPEFGRNRNPARGSGTPTNRNESRNVQPSHPGLHHAAEGECDPTSKYQVVQGVRK